MMTIAPGDPEQWWDPDDYDPMWDLADMQYKQRKEQELEDDLRRTKKDS